MWAHETPAKLGWCGVWADARQCLEWGLSAASSGVAIMGRSGVAQPTHPLLTPTSSSLRRRGTVKCWPLCTRQAWGPFDIGDAYLHDSEAWSVRNHELATALLEIGRGVLECAGEGRHAEGSVPSGHRCCGGIDRRGCGGTSFDPSFVHRWKDRLANRLVSYVEGIVRGGNERGSQA